MVFYPALVYAPVHLGRLFALRHHALDFIDERPHAFAKVRRFDRPVVHFQVDVRSVLAAPNRVRVLVPNALQVSRLAALARARNQQVTAELVMQFHQGGVIRGIEILDASAGNVACALVGFAQVQRDAIENRLVILEVRAEQVVVRLFGHLRHDFSCDCARITRDIVVRLEVRSRGEHQHCGVCALHVDFAVRNRNRTAVGHHVQAILELDGIHRHVVNERVAAVRHAVATVRSRHGGTKTHRAVLVGREAHHNHMVRVACKIFAGVVDAAGRIRRLRDSGFEVEFAAVIGSARMRRSNHQVAHRLKACRARANHIIRYNGFRRAVVATEHGIAGIFQVACRPLLVVVAGAARPDGTFVQADNVFCDATVDNAAHVAVANGQSVGKRGTRIAIVPQF